jgi:NMT1-like family
VSDSKGPRDLKDRGLSFLTDTIAFLKWHRWGVLFALIVVSLGLTLFGQFLEPIKHRKVKLYTGPSLADSRRIGDSLRNYFKTHTADGIIHYEIEILPSDGLLDNRNKVAEANDGELIIGFDQDGFDPPESIRTLIPLAEVYLHIVANKEDVNKLTNPRPNIGFMFGMPWIVPPAPALAPGTPPTVRKLLPILEAKRNGRNLLCYLGPRGSGSRQIGEKVMRHYGIDLRYSDYSDTIGWDAAYRMLRDGDIDLIFDASDFGSPFFSRLADENKFSLVGIDDVEGLTIGQSSLIARSIPKGSYTAKNESFCPATLNTVGTQRLIICNKSLSSYDAYQLTAGIREALRATIPDVHWEKQTQPSPPTGLVVPLHEGAEDYRHQRRPGAWLIKWLAQNWWWLITAIYAVVVTTVRAFRAPIPAEDGTTPQSKGGGGPARPDGGEGPPAPADAPPTGEPEVSIPSVPHAAGAVRTESIPTSRKEFIPSRILRLMNNVDELLGEVKVESADAAPKQKKKWSARYATLKQEAEEQRAIAAAKWDEHFAMIDNGLAQIGGLLGVAELSKPAPAESGPEVVTGKST